MKFTYLLINFFTILIPLARTWEPKLRFYKKFRLWFPGMLFTAVFFLIWDYFKTKYGVWSFNDDYILGPRIGGLPIEEILFFFTVPYACIFIYEAMSYFWDSGIPAFKFRTAVYVLSVILLVASFFFTHKAYTFSVLFIGGLYFPVAARLLRGNTLSIFTVTYLISLLPMAIVNGLLTALPVVIYDNTQNLNIRIGTIPVEDFLYSAILLCMNISLYEWRKNKQQTKRSI